MLRFLAAPAACLVLAAPAAHAAPGQRYVSLPVAASSVPDAPPRPEAQPPRRADAAPAQTGSIPRPAEPQRPWCPPERRVGTGAGFCLIN